MDLLKIIQQIWEIAVDNSRLNPGELSDLVEVSYSPLNSSPDHWILILKINDPEKDPFEEKIYLSQISSEMLYEVDKLFNDIKQGLNRPNKFPKDRGRVLNHSFVSTKIGSFFFHEDGTRYKTMRISPYQSQSDIWKNAWSQAVLDNILLLTG